MRECFYTVNPPNGWITIHNGKEIVKKEEPDELTICMFGEGCKVCTLKDGAEIVARKEEMIPFDDTYCCDGCGKTCPWPLVNWFTSTVGFCEKCHSRLINRVPQTVLDFCYDEIESGSDEVAEFISKLAGGIM